MEWFIGIIFGIETFLFLAVLGQSIRRIELERRLKAAEEKQFNAAQATADALKETLKVILQLNLKVEEMKVMADETYFKKTDVA